MTLKRYLRVIGEAFWEKDAPSFTPEWVEMLSVPRHAGGPPIHYLVIQMLPSLPGQPTRPQARVLA
jgi:hypothetical protein